MKKLIPALALLLVSAVLLATSSFAWFSMNTTVTVTGMSVTTTVDSNLLVGRIGYGTGTDDALTEEDLKASSTQIETGILQPVSTIDGSDFYFVDVTKVNGDGSSNPGTGVYTLWDGSSDINGVTDAKGYVVYDVVLKATATGAQTLSLTKFDITYTPDASESGVVKTFRAAVFKSAAQSTVEAAEAASASTLVTILAPTGAEYFNNSPKQAVTSTSALGNVNANYGTAATIDNTLAANDIKYYHVKVLVWLEGEDTQCTNDTFLTLNGSWAIDVNFAFEKAAVLYANETEYNAAKGTSLDAEGFAALTTEQKTKTPAVAAVNVISVANVAP